MTCGISAVLVRLGNSGLKVSKIILGTMQYGSPAWQPWVLGEEEAIKHIKYAYVVVCSDAESHTEARIATSAEFRRLTLPM